MANRGCNLECVKYSKGGDDVLEFVGPVKIILVDPPRGAYLRKVWYAAAIAMAQMTMAVATVIVMFFSMSYTKESLMKGLHALLCTIGLQLTVLTGILTLNNLSGAAAPMKIADRRSEHAFVQSFGLGCSVAGTVVSLFSLSPSEFLSILTIHSWLGISANIALILGGMFGLCVYKFCGEMLTTEHLGVFRRFIYAIHRILGVIGVILSSACFISGISKAVFIKWLPLNDMYNYIIIFCVFYTIVILYKPIKKFFM